MTCKEGRTHKVIKVIFTNPDIVSTGFVLCSNTFKKTSIDVVNYILDHKIQGKPTLFDLQRRKAKTTWRN
jgi:hypothetical protein